MGDKAHEEMMCVRKRTKLVIRWSSTISHEVG